MDIIAGTGRLSGHTVVFKSGSTLQGAVSRLHLCVWMPKSSYQFNSTTDKIPKELIQHESRLWPKWRGSASALKAATGATFHCPLFGAGKTVSQRCASPKEKKEAQSGTCVTVGNFA
ncbi:hypothetical protein ACFUCV_06190 [Specibacter sp. NPDC057265]|uniref:hypothetical protein n=1 Tax=Specibacter sp. NPDC057265 TaxID=3346075 RepID=UPI0036412C4C